VGDKDESVLSLPFIPLSVYNRTRSWGQAPTTVTHANETTSEFLRS